MAEVALASTLEKQKWLTNYFAEYIRASGYKPYMGTSNNSVIIVKKELQEESGKTINIPLITRLRGNGVTGAQVLDGNEEDLSNYNCAISVDWLRNAVRIPKSTSFKTELDLWGAGKDMLKMWSAEKLRDDITKAFLSIVPASTTVTPVDYGTISLIAAGSGGGFEITAANQAAGASQANLDSWLVLNQDRVLFGAARSNYSSGDHSAALATLDTTADKLTAAVVSQAKRMAKLADPHIRPYRTEEGREFFVMFAGPRSFRDLKTDSTITAANRDARPRDVGSNPIFQDGDLLWDGVIVREVPEIPILTAAGSSTDVQPNFLCGAQALGVAWGQEPMLQTDLQKDYKFRPGVAIEELRKVSKLHFNGVQQGMATVYVAAAADA
jgi:N4-gp56 family major capsid protein